MQTQYLKTTEDKVRVLNLMEDLVEYEEFMYILNWSIKRLPKLVRNLEGNLTEKQTENLNKISEFSLEILDGITGEYE
jgi:hypothetical protein